MWLRLKLAFRNTFRNKRRTSLNVLMIAGGVCTILVFEGFAHRIVVGLRETTIKTQTGHLQIAKSSFWKKTAKNPKQTLLTDYKKWIQQIRKNPHVRYASGRITFFGLLSNGDHTLSAQGVSFDPAAEAHRTRSFKFLSGRGLNPKYPFQIAVGSGLATKLKLKAGQRVTLLAQTYDGVMNALDLEISGVFQTAISEFDDSSFIIPLSSAQTLLDTIGVEQIVVGLDHTSSTGPLQSELSTLLQAGKNDIQIRPWYRLATLYNQVSAFNRIQNQVFQCIILSLILLSILNTVGMSIFERTGEIGTVRALGETPNSVLFQFVLEGLILGLSGALLGAALGAATAYGISAMKIPIVLPGASQPFIMEIHFLFSSVKSATALSVIAATCAAMIPAFRASRMNIITALRRNV